MEENTTINQDQIVNPQPLPNSTAVLVLGITSIVGCCCYGVLGIILAVIAIVLAKNSMKLYEQNPFNYTDKSFQNLKTGRLIAIIGLVLSVIYLIASVIMLITVGPDGIQEMLEQIKEQQGM